MHPDKKKIFIDAAPKESGTERMTEILSSAAVQFFVVLAFWYASLFMLWDVFPEWKFPNMPVLHADILLFLTVFCFDAVVKMLPRRRWGVRLLLFLIYLISGFWWMRKNWQTIEEGTKAASGSFIILLNKHLKTNYPVPEGDASLAAAALLFWFVVLMIFFVILTFSFGRRIFLAALPILVLEAELSIGYAPQIIGFSFLFAGILMLYAGGRQRRRMLARADVSGNGNANRLLHKWHTPVFRAGFLAVSAIFFSMLLFMGASDHLLEKEPEVRLFQRRVEQRMRSFSAGFFTPEQEFIDNQTPQYTGKEVMTVTMPQMPSGNIYLKGFCGTEYRGGRWEYDKNAFEEACVQAGMDSLSVSKMLLQTGYDTIAAYSQTTACTLEYTGMKKRFVYLPYYSDFSGSGEQGSPLGDGTVQKPRGQQTFATNVWTGSSADIVSSSMIGGQSGTMLSWYQKFAEEAYRTVPEEISAVRDYLDPYSELNSGESRSMSIEEYNEQEERTAYLQDLQIMSGWFWENSIELGAYSRNMVYLLMADSVREILADRLSYSLELPAVGDGTDAVQYFLMEGRRGYCIHFASAGTLMLRSLGIPARYASGYIAKQGEFRQRGDVYQASVKDNNAHAWVEIYLEGIGWVPCEMTPGYLDTSADLPTRKSTGAAVSEAGRIYDSSGIQQQNAQPGGQTPQKDDDNKKTDEKEVEETSFWDSLWGLFAGGGEGNGAGVRHNGSGSRMPPLAFLLLALFCIFSAIFTVVRIRRVYFEMPRQDIRRGKCSRAVWRINRRLYLGLCRRGKILRKNIKDKEYEQVLMSAYDFIPYEDWQRYMRIVGAAVFSGREAGTEDARFCYQIYIRCSRRRFNRDSGVFAAFHR